MQTEQNKPEVFQGRTAQMRVSPWLASEDLDGLGDVEVEIEAVYLRKDVPMQDGRKEKQLYTMKFKGKEREMVLKTAENRRTLVALFGTDTRQWLGKKIKLWVKDGVRSPKGGTTKGIRIKAA